MNSREAVVVLLLILILLLFLPSFLAGAEAVRLLYPLEGAQVTGNPVLIMILTVESRTSPSFELNGQRLELEAMTFDEAWAQVPAKVFMNAGSDDLPLRSPLLRDKKGKSLWVAARDLPPGEHVLSHDGVALGGFIRRDGKVEDGDESDQSVLRVHGSPGTKAAALSCTSCHQAGDDDQKATLGVARTPESCHDCHDDVDLSLSHEHVMEFLAQCQMCHDPHAATRPRLLIDSRERVCGLCHESGYAR